MSHRDILPQINGSAAWKHCLEDGLEAVEGRQDREGRGDQMHTGGGLKSVVSTCSPGWYSTFGALRYGDPPPPYTTGYRIHMGCFDHPRIEDGDSVR